MQNEYLVCDCELPLKCQLSSSWMWESHIWERPEYVWAVCILTCEHKSNWWVRIRESASWSSWWLVVALISTTAEKWNMGIEPNPHLDCSEKNCTKLYKMAPFVPISYTNRQSVRRVWWFETPWKRLLDWEHDPISAAEKQLFVTIVLSLLVLPASPSSQHDPKIPLA